MEVTLYTNPPAYSIIYKEKCMYIKIKYAIHLGLHTRLYTANYTYTQFCVICKEFT